MWKSGESPTAATTFFPQPLCRNSTGFQQAPGKTFFRQVFNSFFFHIPQPLWKSLQAGIDVGSDVPNVVLQGGGVPFFQGGIDFTNVIQNRSMVLAKFLTDVRQA